MVSDFTFWLFIEVLIILLVLVLIIIVRMTGPEDFPETEVELDPHNLGTGDLLGCAYPIVLAGMGGVARSELVAAVTDDRGFSPARLVRGL